MTQTFKLKKGEISFDNVKIIINDDAKKKSIKLNQKLATSFYILELIAID
jgi:hypothetical protein